MGIHIHETVQIDPARCPLNSLIQIRDSDLSVERSIF